MSLPAPWLSDAPASWRRTYLGHLVDVKGGGTPSKDEPGFWDGDIPWVSPKDMKVLRLSDSEDHVTEKALKQSVLQLIPSGAVLIVIRGMILDHTVPVALTQRPVTVNQDMKALLPKAGVHGPFLAWQLIGLNPALLARVEEAGHGTKALRTEQWRKLPLAIPTPAEQHSIAAFLDRRTAAIDALIARKERLLALLEEKRQALLEAALEYAPGRTTQLRHVVDLLAGYAFPSEKFVRNESGIRLLRGINVSTDGVRWDEVVRWPSDALGGLDAFALREGDIVFGMDRPWVGSGVRAAVVGPQDLPALLLQRVARLRSRKPLRPGYLLLHLVSRRFQSYFEPELTGVSVPHISPSQILSYAAPLPPLEHQDDVIKSVDSFTARYRTVRGALAQQLTMLREYRQALITAAVTGRLDVAERLAYEAESQGA